MKQINTSGYVEMEARWASQGFIHFKNNHTSGELFFAVKDSLRDNIYIYIYICIVENNHNNNNNDTNNSDNK